MALSGRANADRKATLEADLPGTARQIDTAFGPTSVRILGSGPPVLVVHGGPGFDHRYLVPALLPLAERRSLIFYDQPGCGETQAPSGRPSPEQTFGHFRFLAKAFAKDGALGVIAHSWGALVLIAAQAAATSDDPLPEFDEGLVVAPVGVERSAYDAATARLLARPSPEDLARFGALLTAGDGTGAMAVALPYYRARPFDLPRGEFPLNAGTYLSVVQQLGQFDFSAGLPAAKALHAVLGAEDFTTPELASPYLDACASANILLGVGHFPFYEAPQAFAEVLTRAFPGGSA